MDDLFDWDAASSEEPYTTFGSLVQFDQCPEVTNFDNRSVLFGSPDYHEGPLDFPEYFYPLFDDPSHWMSKGSHTEFLSIPEPLPSMYGETDTSASSACSTPASHQAPTLSPCSTLPAQSPIPLYSSSVDMQSVYLPEAQSLVTAGSINCAPTLSPLSLPSLLSTPVIAPDAIVIGTRHEPAHESRVTPQAPPPSSPFRGGSLRLRRSSRMLTTSHGSASQGISNSPEQESMQDVDGGVAGDERRSKKRSRVSEIDPSVDRWPCSHAGCSVTFSREADVERHRITVHGGWNKDDVFAETRESHRRWCRWCHKILARVDSRLRHEHDNCKHNPNGQATTTPRRRAVKGALYAKYP